MKLTNVFNPTKYEKDSYLSKFFKFRTLDIYLKRQNYRDTQGDFPSASSLLKWLQKPGFWGFIPLSSISSRSPATWVTSDVPRCISIRSGMVCDYLGGSSTVHLNHSTFLLTKFQSTPLWFFQGFRKPDSQSKNS